MSNKVFLLKRNELSPGDIRKVDAGSTPLAVYHINGGVYVTHNTCTHAEASLADGEIVDDDCIACPLHDGQFHIPTGRATGLPCTVAVRTYRVIEEGDDLYVDLDAECEEAAAAV